MVYKKTVLFLPKHFLKKISLIFSKFNLDRFTFFFGLDQNFCPVQTIPKYFGLAQNCFGPIEGQAIDFLDD